jgi:arginase
MDVRIIGVPMDLGANRRGTDMGPSAVRAAELEASLEELPHEVRDGGNVFAHEPETRAETEEGPRFREEIVRTCEALARRVRSAMAEDEAPLVVGGDHSLSMGSVAGVAADDERTGVLWVDAHGDFNTEKTSPSGNVHGMPLAAIVGHGDRHLCEIGGLAPKVREEDVAIVGPRSIDPPEAEALRSSEVSVFTMRDVDEHGMREVMEQALDIVTDGPDRLHCSLDLDVVDPEIAPGVGTPVKGGMSYREAHLSMEMVHDSGALGSMDVVEVNPILDERNRTAEMAVDLTASAFGKQIL